MIQQKQLMKIGYAELKVRRKKTLTRNKTTDWFFLKLI